MNMIIYFQANEIDFYKEGFALGLVLKVRMWISEKGLLLQARSVIN